jgi:hypothetical protein
MQTWSSRLGVRCKTDDSVAKSTEVERRSILAEFSKEGYASKWFLLPMMTMMNLNL